MKSEQRWGRSINIEPEEYKALMAELPIPEDEPESTLTASEIHEKFRKIDFYLMIIVGLILMVLLIIYNK